MWQTHIMGIGEKTQGEFPPTLFHCFDASRMQREHHTIVSDAKPEAVGAQRIHPCIFGTLFRIEPMRSRFDRNAKP
jgi:hypothetical protein